MTARETALVNADVEADLPAASSRFAGRFALALVVLSACVYERVEVGDVDFGASPSQGDPGDRDRDRDRDTGPSVPPFSSIDGDLPEASEDGGCDATPVSVCNGGD